MFTGLIQAIGDVAALKASGENLRLRIRVTPTPGGAAWGHRPSVGDSISINGCCLTVAEVAGGVRRRTPTKGRLRGLVMDFDVVSETLRRTTLGGLSVGSRVNLEHALTPTTLMGGHLVQGHVDGLGHVLRVQRGDDWRVRIAPGRGADGESLMGYVVPKGSICVEGVSLTVAAIGVAAVGVDAKKVGWFEVALIPTTLSKTTLVDLHAGMSVNIEADLISKIVVGWLKRSGVQRRSAARSRPTSRRRRA